MTTLRAIMAVCLLASGVAGRCQKVSVSDVLAGMDATWKATDCYTCTMKTWGKAKGKEKSESFVYSFRKPRLARLKMLTGSNKGADVVYDANGKVTGAKRVLGIRAKQGIGTKDGKVYSARGIPFWEADMGSSIDAIRTLVKEKGGTASAEKTASGVTLKVAWRGTDLAINTGAHDYVRTYTLDPKTWVPLVRETTEDGTPVERVDVSNVNLKADLAASCFDL